MTLKNTLQNVQNIHTLGLGNSATITMAIFYCHTMCTCKLLIMILMSLVDSISTFY